MSEEKTGGFSAKKGCLWAVAIIGGVAIFGAIVGGDPKDGGDKTAVATSETGDKSDVVEGIAVTARELAKAYDENEAAAQIKYGDKPITVTGTITGITLDFMDNPVVQLGGINEFSPVQGNLTDKAVAASLKKGQKITLKCEGVSEVVSMPQLSDCVL
jgi:tRNA_anti-like